jgi:SNF2 family DNA or RNA helicase
MTSKSISPELYLYYSLSIEPFDTWAHSYKKELDLAQVCQEQVVLKNDDVKNHFRKIGLFCPAATEQFIDTCYADYDKDGHRIKIFFYKILNTELLTPSYIKNSDLKNVLTCIHRTINLQNNLLNDYDKYFNAELNNIITTMEKPRYYNLSNIYVNDPNGIFFGDVLTSYPINEILKIKPYDYQKDNINWMLGLEKNPIKEYISADKLLFFPDGRIYNYQDNEFVTNADRELVTLRGGVILDNVGIGKTFQLLCLAMSDTSINTLIVVPDHLKLHWNDQFKKHFNVQLPNFITIVEFSKFSNCQLNKYTRIIVDEIHELYSNPSYKNILGLMFNTGCKYKWGISATPFPVPNSIYNLLRFLTEKDIHYQNTDRFSYFYDTYYKIFRKNTLENIVGEIKLPNITEHNLLLDFNDQERILYDAEIQANQDCDEYFLRKCCCDVMINFKNKGQIISLEDFNNLVIKDYKYKYDVELDKYNKYLEFYDNCLELLRKIDDQHNPELTKEQREEIIEILKRTTRKELFDNISHYKNKMKEQSEIVSNRKQAYEYLNNKINDTNKECPICLCEITDNTDECKYDVPECGHVCCFECMQYWLSSHSSCTVCRRNINKDKMYTITKLNQVKMKYSTKMDKLLEILSSAQNSNDKIIIYTQFDNMIDKLVQTLNLENIGSIQFEDPSQINEFRNNMSKRVLILSSVKNASGIDLSFVSNIVIFEPIIGDTLYLRDIEKQIIGRIYRINQTRDINVYRFIIKDTIEFEIFKKASLLK